MLRARPHFPQEEPCPVPDQLIGELYRSSPHGLDDLLASVPTETRGNARALLLSASSSRIDRAGYSGEL